MHEKSRPIPAIQCPLHSVRSRGLGATNHEEGQKEVFERVPFNLRARPEHFALQVGFEKSGEYRAWQYIANRYQIDWDYGGIFWQQALPIVTLALRADAVIQVQIAVGPRFLVRKATLMQVPLVLKLFACPRSSYARG